MEKKKTTANPNHDQRKKWAKPEVKSFLSIKQTLGKGDLGGDGVSKNGPGVIS